MQGRAWPELELHDRHGELAREGRDGEGEEQGVGERLLAVGWRGSMGDAWRGGLNPKLFCYYALLLPSWIGILGNLCSRLHRGCWMAPSMVGYPHERLLRILILPDDAT
jgi:hypothetical protein